jgi:soluble lytic murein transglycosylase-like protein
MFPAISSSRALDLCVLAAVLTATACASGGPVPVPASPLTSAYEEVAEPRSSPDLRPTPETPSGPERRTAPASRPSRSKPSTSRSSGQTTKIATPKPATPKAATPKAVKPKPAPKARVDSAALELAVTKRHAHRPLALALARRTQNPVVADRAASVVVEEASRLRMSPSLLAAVLLIENAVLDSTAVSTQGAIGMMQVMPMHAGSYGCPSPDLVNVESNICHGARLLKTIMRRSGDLNLALRRYNGCVRGRNTPRCQRYPVRVLRTASRLRREILATAATLPDPLAASDDTSSVETGSLPRESADSADAEEAEACQSLARCLRRRWTR